MEWNNLKAPSWDLSEMEQGTLNNIETTMDGSRTSFGFGEYRTKGEFSVDLKLGQVGNSSTESSKSKDVGVGVGGVSKMTSSSSSTSGSSKRARAINNGTHVVSCLVDGCQADLSNCRDYHRRHKVCELHSKTAQVTIGGHKQRFCQQCSRFHSLEEFDEGKRSCRKRLDGHNKRRRKPQAEAISRSSSFLSNYQGTQLLPFSSSHIYPSSALMNPTWGGTDVRLHTQHNQQMHHLVQKQDLFLGTSSSTTNNSYKEGKQLSSSSFIHQATDQQHHQHLSSSSMNPSFTRTNPFSERYKMICDNNNNNSNTSCALSLLSSPPVPVVSQTHNQHHQMVNAHSSFMQPLGLSLHDHSLGSVDHVLGPNDQSGHCSSIYNLGSNESHSQGNDNDAPPPLYPFQWD